MNNIENDRLKDIYAKVKKDAPSMSFESNLMQRIRVEQLINERKKNRLAIFSILLGAFSMFAIPAVVLHFLGWSILDMFENSQTDIVGVLFSMKIDPLIIFVSIICLLLLIADTLIRKHIDKKE